MQVISVERWTFWSALVLAAVGTPLVTGFGTWVTSSSAGGSTSVAFGVATALLVFVLLLVSVALGGSRDPSVRSLPAQA